MNTSFFPLVLIAGLALACSQQEAPPPQPPETAAQPQAAATTQSMPAIPMRPGAATSQPATPEGVVPDPRAARLAAIEKESEDAMNAYYEAFKAAIGDNERPTPEQMAKIQQEIKVPDKQVWTTQAQQMLTEAPTDLAALHTIEWMLDQAEGPAEQDALVALLEKHHMNRPEMADVCDRLAQVSRGTLVKLSNDSPHVDVRGRATYAISEGLKNDIEMAAYLSSAEPEALQGMSEYFGEERVAALNALDAEKTQKEIEQVYERVVKEYSDVKVNAGTKRETTLGKQAGSALFEIRNLVVGKPAPEIEGVDLDGVAFKLSDYHGKIVLLDFWGNW